MKNVTARTVDYQKVNDDTGFEYCSFGCFLAKILANDLTPRIAKQVHIAEAFSEPCQTPKMERVPILDVQQGFECISA